MSNKESTLMGKDAPADTSTELSFNPPNGPFGSANVVTGAIGRVGDEDWIIIELSEGREYTITVGGDTKSGRLNDSVLKLMRGNGDLIAMNDDKDAAKSMLGSELEFTPEAGSGTQVYYISVRGFASRPDDATNTGGYTVKVAEKALTPGVGAAIKGTSKSDKLIGTANGESITGMGGDDTLRGGAGDDTLDGGAGNDLLVGGPGADTLKGGKGDIDTISYRDSAMGVTINLDTGAASGGDAAGDTLGKDIENVIGSAHDDTLSGSGSANTIWGLGGNDALYGDRRNDKLYGGAGDDSLDGGDNDDTLTGGAGADLLVGGGGVDTASWDGSLTGVTVRLHANQAMGGDAEGDVFGDLAIVEYSLPAADPEDPPVAMTETVPDIVHLTGSAQADVLAGDSRDNIIKGNGGDDRLYGGPGGGNDTLAGGDGNDSLFGGMGMDTLIGGQGDDTLSGGPGADELEGGAGNDVIYADLMDLGAINGGEGTDTVSFEKMADKAIGTIAEPFTLASVAGIEHVIGTDEDDYITGDASANVIEGGEGGDTLNGGEGEDTLSYEGSNDWVRITLTGSTTENNVTATASRGHASGDNATNFENIRGSAHGDDLAGNGDANKLWGLAGDDTLEGGAGDDTLEGGAGDDKLDGGKSGEANAENTEKNTLSYFGSDAGVTVNLATVSVSGGHAEGDEIETYEFLDDMGTADNTSDDVETDVATFVNVTGSMHDDSLTGDRFANRLEGGDGNDSLHGGAGADALVGGKGADILDGGEDKMEENNLLPRTDTNEDGVINDDDEAAAAASVDWAMYRDSKDGVTVNLSTNRGEAGDAMGDELRNIELVWGSRKDDIFIASSGADLIHGDGGSDTVSYETSEIGVTVNLAEDNNNTGTTFTGSGTAADPFVFSWTKVGDPDVSDIDAEGVPQVDEDDDPDTNGATGDRLGSIENLTGSDHKDALTGDANPNVLKGMGGNDTLNGGGGNDRLYGGDGVDTLNGGAGGDTLNGSAGDDTLNGGAGDDDLYGGDGADTFVLSPTDGAGSDFIADFSVAANDRIDLSAFEQLTTSAQVMAAMSIRGDSAVINLEEYGGGRIVLDDVDNLNDFSDDTFIL